MDPAPVLVPLGGIEGLRARSYLRKLATRPAMPGYLLSVPLIAGCPGLVPAWRAFPCYEPCASTNPSTGPFSPLPCSGRGEKGPVEGCAVAIAYCSCIACATPAQDRGSLTLRDLFLTARRDFRQPQFTQNASPAFAREEAVCCPNS